MKISIDLLKQLILEEIKHYKDDPRFPISIDRPKTKYITTDDEFLSAFKPVVSFSQESANEEMGISLFNLLNYIFLKKDVPAKRLASEFNAEFKDSGAKFSSSTMEDIKDILNADKKIFKSTEEIKKRLELLDAERKVQKYVPEKEAEPPFKTSSDRAPFRPFDAEKTEPDFTPPELKEKKVRVRYKCN